MAVPAEAPLAADRTETSSLTGSTGSGNRIGAGTGRIVAKRATASTPRAAYPSPSRVSAAKHYIADRAVARPEFTVFFKGGWLPEIEGLVNQAGRLEGHGITFSLAVMSTHDRSMEYGEGTIEGVTARLLGRAH
jgi:hypothetical protein